MNPPDSNPEGTADALWGPGNWVRCDPCPANDSSPSIHQKDFHANYEKPTGTMTHIQHPAHVSFQMCGQEFYEKNHRAPMPWRCEQPVGHPGAHSIPRTGARGPDPV